MLKYGDRDVGVRENVPAFRTRNNPTWHPVTLPIGCTVTGKECGSHEKEIACHAFSPLILDRIEIFGVGPFVHGFRLD